MALIPPNSPEIVDHQIRMINESEFNFTASMMEHELRLKIDLADLVNTIYGRTAASLQIDIIKVRVGDHLYAFKPIYENNGFDRRMELMGSREIK